MKTRAVSGQKIEKSKKHLTKALLFSSEVAVGQMKSSRRIGVDFFFSSNRGFLLPGASTLQLDFADPKIRII